MLLKRCTQYANNFGKIIIGHRTGNISFHSNPKESQCQRMLKLSHNCTHQKEMATHSIVLAWRIPGTEQPGGLPSVGLHRVGHDEVTQQQQQMFFWNSLAFYMIQQMLAIWSLVALLFLNPVWICGNSWFTYCWSLAWRILSFTLLACEMSAIVR